MEHSMGNLTSKILTVIGLALTCAVCTSQPCSAKNGDEIVFECEYTDGRVMHDHMVADNKGITITQYRDHKYYYRNYTTNGKDGSDTSYYRKNRFEVAWANNYFYKNKLLVHFDSLIDRETGILKNAGGLDEYIREVGRCTESTP